jgi:hypothetical protein
MLHIGIYGDDMGDSLLPGNTCRGQDGRTLPPVSAMVNPPDLAGRNLFPVQITAAVIDHQDMIMYSSAMVNNLEYGLPMIVYRDDDQYVRRKARHG